MSREVVDARLLEKGNRIEMENGAIAEIVSNPRDGMWVFGRFVSHPDAEMMRKDGEHAIFAPEILRRIED